MHYLILITGERAALASSIELFMTEARSPGISSMKLRSTKCTEQSRQERAGFGLRMPARTLGRDVRSTALHVAEFDPVQVTQTFWSWVL